MKRITQKKPKVYRTLIRLIHTGVRPELDDSHVQKQGKRMNSNRDKLYSFSAGGFENKR